MKIDTVIIIGLGSIGQHYYNYLKKKLKIIIVDITKEKALFCREEGIKYFFSTVNELKSAIKYPKKCLGVISNWGPDHLKTVKDLSELGVKSMIIEKPMTTSIKDAYEIKKIEQEKNLKINVHFRWSYLNLHSEIKNIINQFELGEPKGFQSLGGSLCISTGGVHWMDFARKLFNTNPHRVTASLYSDKINPRSSDFDYFGGCVIFDFNDSFIIEILHIL